MAILTIVVYHDHKLLYLRKCLHVWAVVVVRCMTCATFFDKLADDNVLKITRAEKAVILCFKFRPGLKPARLEVVKKYSCNDYNERIYNYRLKNLQKIYPWNRAQRYQSCKRHISLKRQANAVPRTARALHLLKHNSSRTRLPARCKIVVAHESNFRERVAMRTSMLIDGFLEIKFGFLQILMNC